ncbi:MAG: response regulator [Balneolaceae bacterium]|jgi:chemosensory pili system protein ChpA (sensor histidine kinase/response regulator)
MKEQSPVYIIDDSRIQVIILEKILIKEGFCVKAFSNGYDLIKKLDDENPTLIISDIEMPMMDGFELLSEIQKKSCCKDIPFFFISSNGDSSILKKAQKMGAKSFIEKPFKSELLVEMVREAILN